MATLLSVAMMLETECDAKSEANQLRSAIAHCIKNGFTTSDVKNGTETTQSVTDKICQLIASDTI
jgi:isocitrate/isopropylmalate dehydrogenase